MLATLHLLCHWGESTRTPGIRFCPLLCSETPGLSVYIGASNLGIGSRVTPPGLKLQQRIDLLSVREDYSE